MAQKTQGSLLFDIHTTPFFLSVCVGVCTMHHALCHIVNIKEITSKYANHHEVQFPRKEEKEIKTKKEGENAVHIITCQNYLRSSMSGVESGILKWEREKNSP